MEDYEKKYKEALSRAATELETCGADKSLRNMIYAIFPDELKESEDERIRKALIRFHKSTIDVDGIKGDDILAWLEKQGTPAKLSEEEQNRYAKVVLTSCAESFIKYLDAHKYEGKMCVSNGECEDIENAFHNAMWDRLHRYYCKYIEKQGDNNNQNWKPSKGQINALEHFVRSIGESCYASPYDDNTNLLNSLINDLYKLEKQGEQKPTVVDFNAKDWYVSKVDGKIHDMTYNSADKVEPKFKVKYAGSEYNVLEVKDIAGVTFYGIEDEPNHIDYVKADNCEIISGYGIKENGSPYPTKPSMFSEQKPADKNATTKQDGWLEIPFGAKDSELQEATYYIPKGFHAEIDDDKVAIKKGEKPVAWSDEDEGIVLSIEQVIQCASSLNLVPEKLDKIDNWLKSLKERVQPQYLTITNEELVQAKKEAYNDALDKIEYHSDTPTFNDGWSAAIWYLKKKNAMPQTQWKPSDEQLLELRCVISGCSYETPILIQLEQDLKKLL